MKKWFYRILWVPALAAAVLFLVANRRPVAISLDPFSATDPAVATAALPLWFWLMAMLFIGVSVGAFGMWLSGAPRRRKTRAAQQELKTLRQEVAAMEQRLRDTPPQEETAALSPPEPASP